MEGKIDMATRRQVTNILRDAYRNGSKAERRSLHPPILFYPRPLANRPAQHPIAQQCPTRRCW